MPIVAMTKEMGSLGTFVGLEVARRLGYEFLRNDLVTRAAREFRVREAGVVGALERSPGLAERLGGRSRRYKLYLEASVLEAALRERVVLMGRWSTIFLHGVGHAVRVRVCAPVEVRAQRIMSRLSVDHDEAVKRIAAYDEGVQARMRQMFGVDWTDSLLYDLVINTETVTLESGVRQVLALCESAEFQPTAESLGALRDRALAAQVGATLKATAATAGADLDVQASGGRVMLSGLVASEREREAVETVAREVRGVTGVTTEVRVFRRPIR